MFFEVKTKRLTVNENNAYRKVREQWLLDCETYTEAEAEVTKFMQEKFPKESFTISKIQPSKVTMLANTDKELTFYKVKIETIEIGDNEKERRESVILLVGAESTEESIKVAEDKGNEEFPNFEVTRSEKTKFTGIIGA